MTRCSWASAFTSVSPISELNLRLFVGRPRLTPDERTIVYHRAINPAGSEIHLYFSEWQDGGWGPEQSIPGTVTQQIQTDPALTGDGRLVCSSTYYSFPGTGTYQLVQAVEGAYDGGAGPASYGGVTALPSQFTEAGAHHFAPFITSSGVLWFTSQSAVMPSLRTTWTAQPSDGGWGTPVQALGGLSSTGPVVSADELTLYVGIDGPADGGYQIGVAHRADAGQPFGSPVPLGSLQLAAGMSYEPSWISPDECRLYFFRYGVGVVEAWVAAR